MISFFGNESSAENIDILLSEEDFFYELPLVLSLARLAQPADEARIATTVIDRHMIEASGATEIFEVLRLVPGMSVAYQDSVFPTASYHGLSSSYSRRMQVLIDGRSVYDPAVGDLLWQSVPVALDNIERIEVIRGPSASSHGANSFLGVISITTRRPSDSSGIYSNASSGNLHPTETYVILPPLLEEQNNNTCIYHYTPKNHILEKLTEFKTSFWVKDLTVLLNPMVGLPIGCLSNIFCANKSWTSSSGVSSYILISSKTTFFSTSICF